MYWLFLYDAKMSIPNEESWREESFHLLGGVEMNVGFGRTEIGDW